MEFTCYVHTGRVVSECRNRSHRSSLSTNGSNGVSDSPVLHRVQDDYAFGVLHSRTHEIWSLRMGTWLGKGNDPRYTPTSTFETFPFPWPLNEPEDALTTSQKAHRDLIASAARALNEARKRWLNPAELVREEPDVIPELPPRLVPVDEDAEKELKKRTLTNLYNERPTWLANSHAALDAAVFAAYGWPEPPDQLTDAEILARLLKLNLEREPA